MAAHSSILAWRIPETEEPSGLWPTGSHRIGCATNAKPSWRESAPPAPSGAQALLFPGGCPSPGPQVSLWSVGKAALEAGGWDFQGSARGELGEGALRPATPVCFPPPSHCLAPV